MVKKQKKSGNVRVHTDKKTVKKMFESVRMNRKTKSVTIRHYFILIELFFDEGDMHCSVTIVQ